MRIDHQRYFTKGKIIALLIFASWIAVMLVMSMLRPRFMAGKELLTAARTGDVRKVESLISSGASLAIRDAEGHTALWMASYYGRTELAELLMQHGADANSRGMDGWTPLFWAAKNGNVEVVKRLIAHHADVNAMGNHGETALGLVTNSQKDELTKILKAAGAR